MNLSESYKRRLQELADIKTDVVVLKAPYMDKNSSIQISTNDKLVHDAALRNFYQLKNMYPKLKLFLQSNTSTFLMFESWAKEDDLMYQAAEWLANKLNLPLEID